MPQACRVPVSALAALVPNTRHDFAAALPAQARCWARTGEDRVFTLKMTIGCLLALTGFGLYSAVRLQQSQAASAAKRPPSEENPNPAPKGSPLAAEMEPLVAKQSSLHQLEVKAAAGRMAAEPQRGSPAAFAAQRSL